MGLIARVSTVETVNGFRAAATARFREASHLITSGDRLAGIYLSGYAAEMLLKAAFFRLEGYDPDHSLNLNDARSRAKAWGLSKSSNYHDLPWWAGLIVEHRKMANRPFAQAFSAAFVGNVNRIYLNWREFLRYRTNRPSIQEIARVRAALTWLMGQYRFLY